jgi:ABC-type Fe3+-citrate transport system substrate-binding protein
MRLSWKDILVIIGTVALFVILLIDCSASDNKVAQKVATVSGDVQVHKYEEDPYVCFILTNAKDTSADSISCVHK